VEGSGRNLIYGNIQIYSYAWGDREKLRKFLAVREVVNIGRGRDLQGTSISDLDIVRQ
jgi:hypothetical protein